MVTKEKVLLNDRLEEMKLYVPQGQFEHIILSEYVSSVFADEISDLIEPERMKEKKELFLKVVKKEYKIAKGILGKEEVGETPDEFAKLLAAEIEQVCKEKFAEQFSSVSTPYTTTLSLVYGFNYVQLKDVYTNLIKHFGDDLDSYAKEHLNTNQMIVFELMSNDLEKVGYLTKEQYNRIYKDWLKQSVKKSSEIQMMKVLNSGKSIEKPLSNKH